MKLLQLIAAYIPYEQGERYALGERRDVPMFYVVGGIITLALMVWFMRKTKKDKRRGGRK